MASTLSWTSSFTVNNGSFAPGTQLTNQITTLAGQGATAGIITTSSSALTDVPLQSVSTLGYAFFCNLDGTNKVDIGLDNSSVFVAVMTLGPGESCIFRWKTGVVPAVKAEAGTPNVQYLILNN